MIFSIFLQEIQIFRAEILGIIFDKVFKRGIVLLKLQIILLDFFLQAFDIREGSWEGIREIGLVSLEK